jgi:hypothetical protein
MPRTLNYDFNITRTVADRFNSELESLIEGMELILVRTTWPSTYAPSSEVCHVDYNHNGETVPALLEDCFSCEQCGSMQHNDSRAVFDPERNALFCCDGCVQEYAVGTSYTCIETSSGSNQWFDVDCSGGELASYNSINKIGFNTSEEHPFLVGMEVEKCDCSFHERGSDTTNIIADAIEYDWIAVSDGSLDYDCGFELVSPAYNLTGGGDYGKDALENTLKEFGALNAESDSSCGGHITVSALGLSGPQLAARLEPLFPLLYALYPNRVGNEYSGAMRGEMATHTGVKFRAVNVLANRVEFRLFSGVKTGDQLSKRIDVLREALKCVKGDNGLLMESEAREELQAAIDNKDSALWASVSNLVGDSSESANQHREDRIKAFKRWYNDGSMCAVIRRYLCG